MFTPKENQAITDTLANQCWPDTSAALLVAEVDWRIQDGRLDDLLLARGIPTHQADGQRTDTWGILSSLAAIAHTDHRRKELLVGLDPNFLYGFSTLLAHWPAILDRLTAIFRDAA